MSVRQQELQDALILQQIELTLVSNGIAARGVSLLNRADAELSAKIKSGLTTIGPGRPLQRLERLLGDVREINKAAYAPVNKKLNDSVTELSRIQTARQSALLASLAPKPKLLTADEVYAAVVSRPFQGRLLKDWMPALEVERAKRIRDAIRQGYLQKETPKEIADRIIGTKERGYSDGIIQIDRAHLETVIRTALSHTAATAREKTFGANSELFAAWCWVSVLDDRTSAFCRPRNLKRYTLKHQPVGHAFAWGAGPGRAHWGGCRSIAVPILKGEEDQELEGKREAREYDKSNRGRKEKVAADTTYGDWLRRQPAHIQDKVLGRRRAELFRSGAVQIDDFYNDKGRWLRLDQLLAP